MTAGVGGRRRGAGGLWLLALAGPAMLAGCHRDRDGGTPAGVASASVVLGPDGGTLRGPDGVELVVPPGALAEETTLTVRRTSEGAPALADEWKVAGQVYEFTPHGLSFFAPVTFRLPFTGDPLAHSVLMASPGEGWAPQEATLEGGQAVFQRSRLSWGGAYVCNVPADAAPNDESCFLASGAGWVSASPASALTDFGGQPAVAQGPLGALARGFRVHEATQLTFSVTYLTAASCQGSRARLLRLRDGARTPEVLADVPAPLANYTPVPEGFPVAGPGASSSSPAQRARGTVTFPPVAVGHADDGRVLFLVGQSCTGVLSGRSFGGGETFSLLVDVPPPAVTFSLGGAVSGLTGSGLVLRNGGDTLPVGADGPFTFGARVGAGEAYAVTVDTQPAGQVCAVAGGSGTATADVTSVAVTCAAAPAARAWQGAVPISSGGAGPVDQPVVAVNAAGDAVVAWAQSDGTTWDIWARRHTRAGGWGAEVRIDDRAGAAAYPHVALNAAGDAVAVWQQFTGSQYEVLASRALAGGVWERPVVIGTGSALTPWVTWLGGGEALAVWSQLTAGIIGAARLGSGGWSAAGTVGGTLGAPREPRLVALGAEALAVWAEQDGSAEHVRFSRFDGAAWGAAGQVSDPASTFGRISGPALAGDGTGRALAVWTQATGSFTSAAFARRLDAGAWGAIEQLSSGLSDGASWAGVAMNSAGQGAAAWGEGSGDGANPWGNASPPAGGWASPARLDGTLAGGRGGGLDVAIASSGEVVVVFEEELRGVERDLFAVHRSVAGVWGSPVPLEAADAGVSAPRVAFDGAGDALAIWVQADAGVAKVWANEYR